MSASLLDEYKAYYSVKAERYADSPNYKHSDKAEKTLSEAMQSCSELSDFKEKMGNLNEKCAVVGGGPQSVSIQPDTISSC